MIGRARPLHHFLGAAQFLTRVPVRLGEAARPADCVPWFPIVGACVGLTVGALAAGMAALVPASVAAAVAVLVGVLITGAFHEDGLADLADSMGGWTPEQRRRILEDPRHGSYGVAALCGSIVLRIVCVATLGPAVAFSGLVAAHTLGRSAAVGVMIAAREHGPEHAGSLGSVGAGGGLGSESIRTLRPLSAVVGIVSGVAIVTLATGWWVLPLGAGATVGAVVVSVVAVRALGAISGDVLGAVEQVGECVVLVIVTGLATHHQLWWS